jgi:hypothetical protein
MCICMDVCIYVYMMSMKEVVPSVKPNCTAQNLCVCVCVYVYMYMCRVLIYICVVWMHVCVYMMSMKEVVPIIMRRVVIPPEIALRMVLVMLEYPEGVS